jgi:hypothetical protein
MARGFLSGLLQLAVPSLTPDPKFLPTPFGESTRLLSDESARASSKHAALARRWTYLHYLLGVATATLAAISGFGSLGEVFSTRTGAFVALAAAVTSAISLFLKTDEQQKRHAKLAADWDDLHQDVENMYLAAPGAMTRIEWLRESQRYGYSERRLVRQDPSSPADGARGARARQRSAPAGLPPDPDGWQELIGQLQQRAKAVRRGHASAAEPAAPN